MNESRLPLRFLITVLLLPLLTLVISGPVYGQNDPGITDYIRGLESDGEGRVSTIAGMPVRNVTSDETGLLVELDAEGIPVRLALVEETELKYIGPALRLLHEEVLEEDMRTTETRAIEIADVLVSVGREGALFIELEITRLEIRLDERMLLDFAQRLTGSIRLRSLSGESSVSCTIPMEGIDIPAVQSESFPGWDELERQLRRWASRGMDRNDQHVMGIILEIRRFEEGEIEQEKEIVFEPPQKEHWGNLHFSLEVSLPEVVLARAEGVDIGIPSVMVQPLLCMEVFCLQGDEVFRPYSIWLYLGPFMDLRLYSMLNEEYDNLHQVLPAGLTVSAGFSGYHPRIHSNRLTGRSFGVGGELQARTNIVALAAGGDQKADLMLAGEYVMDITPALVIHMLPNGFPPLDMNVGFPLKIFSNENTGSWELYSLGLSFGVRIRCMVTGFYRKES